MAIYSGLHIDTTGPSGTQLRPHSADDADLKYVGEMGGRHYYIGMAGGDQHAEIDLRIESMTPEIDALIKRSQVAAAEKQTLRKNIADEVGDLHDLLADQAKVIEFLFVLTARMAEEYLGGNTIPSAKKTEYLARVQAVTGALDAGGVTLRGDFTDPDTMLGEVIARTDTINTLVKTKYADQINALVQL